MLGLAWVWVYYEHLPRKGNHQHHTTNKQWTEEQEILSKLTHKDVWIGRDRRCFSAFSNSPISLRFTIKLSCHLSYIFETVVSTLVSQKPPIQHTIALRKTNISPLSRHVWVDGFPFPSPFGGIGFLVPRKRKNRAEKHFQVGTPPMASPLIKKRVPKNKRYIHEITSKNNIRKHQITWNNMKWHELIHDITHHSTNQTIQLSPWNSWKHVNAQLKQETNNSHGLSCTRRSHNAILKTSCGNLI